MYGREVGQVIGGQQGRAQDIRHNLQGSRANYMGVSRTHYMESSRGYYMGTGNIKLQQGTLHGSRTHHMGARHITWG